MKKYSVVICGGGSTYTPDMMELLCMMQKDFPLKKLVLFDVDKERQDIVGKFGEVMFREYYPELEYSYTLDPEEACVEMELLGHSFFVFRNAQTNEVNVVYKRKGNTYGLIEPEN